MNQNEGGGTACLNSWPEHSWF